MNHLLILSLTLILLCGCAATPAPAVKVYTILPQVLPAADSGPGSTKTLRILPVRSLSSLASRELYYLKNDSEVAPYLYSRWSDTPSAMIGRSLTASLQQRNALAALVSPASTAKADWDLESELGVFHHRFNDDGTSEGVFDLSVRLIDLHTKNVIASKHFAYRIHAQSNDASGGVGALEKAVRLYSADCSDWIATLAREKP